MDSDKRPTETPASLNPLVQDHLAQELLQHMRELHAQLEYLQLLMRLQLLRP